MKKINLTYYALVILLALLPGLKAVAQPQVSAKVDARQITVGDQLRMFIEAKPDKNERLIWATIPDTFNNLEVVEKGKIDTVNTDGITTYKQRLLITGWDSGMFTIPSFEFTSAPKSGAPYTVATDSFAVIVQTIPVDTTQPFRPIADIMEVKTTWRDYIWYILGGLLAAGLIAFVIYYFSKNKKVAAPVQAPPKYVETPNEKALRLLAELEQKQLWQHDQVKQYYTELTDILRVYIEERFRTPAMELTSDELLLVIRRHKEMMRHYDALSMVLSTADMAKFAKAQPLPQEHTDAFEYTQQFVQTTKPVVTENTDKK
ncbi:MAG: hypothetical protein KDC07_09300 [Chitinophagaceae bacterium]|nr:hypothetical protein [Chitinophagaceae bacterium]MCB9047771.1 hypothetical protein [Chitinophagales bacterium]